MKAAATASAKVTVSDSVNHGGVGQSIPDRNDYLRDHERLKNEKKGQMGREKKVGKYNLENAICVSVS